MANSFIYRILVGICFMCLSCGLSERPFTKEPAINSSKHEASRAMGYVTNIEEDTINNNYFREVLYTGKHSQLTVMSLKPKGEIGKEIHDVDQFFRIEAGKGIVIINGVKHLIADGSAIVVPGGAVHNVINTSESEPLKLYTIYSPPHHKDGVTHKTKEESIKKEAHFDGVTTE